MRLRGSDARGALGAAAAERTFPFETKIYFARARFLEAAALGAGVLLRTDCGTSGDIHVERLDDKSFPPIRRGRRGPVHGALLFAGLLQDRAAHVSTVRRQGAGRGQAQLGLFGQHLIHAGFVAGDRVLRDDGGEEVRGGLARLAVLLLDGFGDLSFVAHPVLGLGGRLRAPLRLWLMGILDCARWPSARRAQGPRCIRFVVFAEHPAQELDHLGLRPERALLGSPSQNSF
jgi:hypothetical protein